MPQLKTGKHRHGAAGVICCSLRWARRHWRIYILRTDERPEHQNYAGFPRILKQAAELRWGVMGGEGVRRVPVPLKWSAIWTCPSLLFHYGKVTRGPVCSPNTINKVSAAHQYCYLHRVLICSPYNHKMLIAPINSQSVCALVWPPWALKVSVKMNCSLIPLQEKVFFSLKTTEFAAVKSKGAPLLYHFYHSQWVAANGVEILWSDLSF